MAGTVNVSRDLWDDPTFKDSEMSQREAWIWMIAEASWKARVKRAVSIELELQRGQLVASTRFMAKAWMWSEPRVRRYLDMLENRRMIRRETDAGITVITICKYDEYQNTPSNSDAPATQQPTHQRRTSDANDNKGEIRDIDGGDSAQAREPLPSDPTWREQMLGAMGVDPSGLLGANGKVIGQRLDLETADRWERDLGLSRDAILTVIRETIARKRDGPPASFRYFTRAMEREAARRAEPPLQPASHDEVNHDRQPARDHREATAADRHQRIILAAATARSPSR